MEIVVEKHSETELCTDIACKLNPELLGDWDSLSNEVRKIWDNLRPIPCEGNGIISYCCLDCRYAEINSF